MDYSRLFSLKHVMLYCADFQVTGCCLVTFVWCYSIGVIRKCFNYDLRRTSIFPQCEKGSNIYICLLIGSSIAWFCIYLPYIGHLILCVEFLTTEFNFNVKFRLLPMTTINMHMKFEIEIPNQTWLTLWKPCHLQSPETEKSNMATRRPFWK